MTGVAAAAEISRIGAAAMPGWAQALLFVVAVAGVVGGVAVLWQAWRKR